MKLYEKFDKQDFMRAFSSILNRNVLHLKVMRPTDYQSVKVVLNAKLQYI